MKDLTIEITNSCSLNCLHCSTNAEVKNKFFSLGKIKEILSEFPDFDTVRLSGGEPFEHPELKDILKEIKKRNKKTIVLSSGVCFGREIAPETIESIKEYTDEIMLSIYGGKEIHDGVCNLSGAHAVLKKSIKSINDGKVPFSFETVAMKETLGSLGEILAFINETRQDYCAPKLRIIRFIKQGRGKTNQHSSLSGEEIKKMMALSNVLSKKYSVQVNFGCSLKESGCTAGLGKAAYTINEEKLQCSSLKYGAKGGLFACKDRW
jgi:MoaA/NifB/PqqE/SkfB family radical SAM enzyme